MKIHCLRLTFWIISFCVISCSKDETTSTTPEVVGTYLLSQVTVSEAQDIDEDGNASTNLLDELPCINGQLRINSDNSWTLNVVTVSITSITNDLFFIDCSDTRSSTGQWVLSGGVLRLNDGINPTLYSIQENTLTENIGDDLPGIRQLVFTKS